MARNCGRQYWISILYIIVQMHFDAIVLYYRFCAGFLLCNCRVLNKSGFMVVCSLLLVALMCLEVRMVYLRIQQYSYFIAWDGFYDNDDAFLWVVWYFLNENFDVLWIIMVGVFCREKVLHINYVLNIRIFSILSKWCISHN